MRIVCVVLWGLLGSVACKGQQDEPKVGSETNFLRYCDRDCGEGLTCVCGTCTRACTGPSECEGIAGSPACVALPSVPGGDTDGTCQKGATCDSICVTSADCSHLGSNYRCDAGYCRKGERICPETVLPVGDRAHQIVVGGTTRNFTLHVPANYAGNTPVPLVLDFHPMGLGSEWQQSNSGFRELADQRGFIVVWPEGLENTWNFGPCCALTQVGDDFAFARAIVRQLSLQACVDLRRVYATGFSMGGGMAYYLGCQQSEVFAAIAVSGMDLFMDVACQPSRPITEISFRGTADAVVPYAGGISNPPGYPNMAFELLGADATFRRWAEIDACTGAPSARDANGCSTYSTCKDGTEVTLCTAEGGGQTVGDAARAWETLARHATF